MTVDLRSALPSDYDAIASVLDEWWQRPVLQILPRLFLNHFWPTSLVAEQGRGLAGFLVGLHSPGSADDAYIHAVGVRPDLRAAGLGRDLYETFFARARLAGRTTVSAVTSTGNLQSVAFHRRMGFDVSGPITDYHGPGQDRVVFIRTL